MVITAHMISFLTSYLVCSYAVALVLIAHKALRTEVVDLCDLVRRIIYAPFVTVIVGFFSFVIVGVIWLLVWELIIPNIFTIIKFLLMIIGGLVLFTAFSMYVISPAVKKSYGVVKPFSSKICIVLYKKK